MNAPLDAPATTTPRVMMVASGDLWAGAEAQILTLAGGLHESGAATIHVALLNEGELARRLRERGVAVSCFPESAHGAGSIFAQLWRLTSEFQPNVIHTHRAKEHVLGGMVALLRGIASLRSVHGRQEHRVAATDWRRRIARAVDTLVARLAQRTVVSVSSELTSHLQSIYPFARVVTIDNGVDIAAIRRAANGAIDTSVFAGADRHVAAIGRLVPVKRFDRAIDIALAFARQSSKRTRLHLIGDGPDAASLGQQIVAARATGADIVAHGFVANPLPLLGRMQALLFTSDHEGMPMTALESLALGVPIVSRRIGGLLTLNAAGAAVHLVERDEPSAFVEAIAALDDAPAPPPLPERFTAAFSSDAYAQLYRDCVARGKRP